MKTKSVEVTVERYIRKSIQAFLEGEKDLRWLTGVVRSADPTKAQAAEALRRLTGYGDPVRAQALSDWLQSSGS